MGRFDRGLAKLEHAETCTGCDDCTSPDEVIAIEAVEGPTWLDPVDLYVAQRLPAAIKAKHDQWDTLGHLAEPLTLDELVDMAGSWAP